MIQIWITVSVFASAVALGYFLVSVFVSSPRIRERALSIVGAYNDVNISIVIPPERLYLMIVLSVALMFMLGMLLAAGNIVGGVILGTVLAVPGLFIPSMGVTYAVNKRMERIHEELPGALDILSSAMSAGLTLNQAISRNLDKIPATIASEFKIIDTECRLGASLVDAMKHWADRVPLMDVRLTAIATELALRRGGDLPGTYRKLSSTIRERAMFQKEVRTLTTEGRMQAVVMTLLPFVILVIMTLIRRSEMLQFLTSSVGIGAICVVVLMQIVAYLWIKKMITINV